MDRVWSELASVIFGLIVPFGPAAYVLIRIFGTRKPPSTEMIGLALGYTAFMLFLAKESSRQIQSQLQEACSGWENDLTKSAQYRDSPSDRTGDICHRDYEPILYE